MSWDVIQKNWQRYLGQVRILWGKLTEDELKEIKGRRDVLIDLIHRKYQIPKYNAEEKVKIFESLYDTPDPEELKKDPKPKTPEPSHQAGANVGT